MKYQTIIGRFEHVNFVGFIDDVPAKIDTGECADNKIKECANMTEELLV